ncbi:MAG: ABC transporter permease [Dongiaceae bacterium]
MSNSTGMNALPAANTGRWRRQDIGRFALRYSLVIVLVFFVIALSISDEHFLTFSNFEVILQQIAANALLATGMTFVILTGGIDLSVGSIVGMSGVVAAMLAQDEGTGQMLEAAALGILAGGAVGAFNGSLVSFVRVPPFVATLGTMTIALGIAYVLSDGRPVSGLSDSFLTIGNNSIFGVPIPVAIFIAVLLVSYVILAQTRFGMHVYASGGNPHAARIAGVSVRFIRFAVYTISGLLAGLCGVIMASRVTAGIATTGASYELNAIAAAVIGGVSLMGGRGKLIGTVFGLLIIGVLDNGLNILNVSPFYQLIIKGLIIIGAVFIDSYLNSQDD